VQLPSVPRQRSNQRDNLVVGGTGCPGSPPGTPTGVMVFALPENSVIKMKFCGLLARGQKPRHRDTRQLHIPPAVRCKGKPRLHNDYCQRLMKQMVDIRIAKLAIITLLTILLTNSSILSQSISEIIVIDSLTRQPIPYVSIAFTVSKNGTYSNNAGIFSKPIDNSIYLSCVGYHSKYAYVSSSTDTILLTPKLYEIPEIVISKNSKPRDLEIGYAKEEPLFAKSNSSGSEIAVLISDSKGIGMHINKVVLRILKKDYALKSNNIDFTSVFMINFYNATDNMEVGEQINKDRLILNSDQLTKRTIIDVSNLNLQMSRNGVFVSIEWIGKENIQNNDLYVITENLLEPFIQTTFKVNNSVVYEKNKLTNYAWKTVDKGNPFSIMLKKENGFTPMISLILQ